MAFIGRSIHSSLMTMHTCVTLSIFTSPTHLTVYSGLWLIGYAGDMTVRKRRSAVLPS